jgi:signal transduction histidine kinase/PAS domain-containing protein
MMSSFETLVRELTRLERERSLDRAALSAVAEIVPLAVWVVDPSLEVVESLAAGAGLAPRIGAPAPFADEPESAPAVAMRRTFTGADTSCTYSAGEHSWDVWCRRQPSELVLVIAVDAASNRDLSTQLRLAIARLSELRSMELSLERALSLSRSAINACAEGVLIVNPDGHIAAYNRRFVEMWRIPPEVVRVRNDDLALSFVLDQLSDPDAFMRRVRELYHTPEATSVDLLPFKDGRVFERISHPQRLGNRIVGRVWSFRDVTAQVRAESERDRLLARSEEVRRNAQRAERRAGFLANASRLLASLDYRSALVSVARYVAGTLGDWCLIDLFEGTESRRIGSAHVDPTKRSGLEERASPAGSVEVALSGRPGVFSPPPASAVQCQLLGRGPYLAVPLVAQGESLGVLTLGRVESGSWYDSADLSLAEELAARAALAVENARVYEGARAGLRARDQLLSVASHELRGPLTALSISVEGLRTHRLDEEPAKKALGIIDRQMKRLAHLVDDLLDVTRIRAGVLNIETEDVDLADVVRAVVVRTEPEWQRAGSEIHLALTDGLVGHWDRSRLDQVVTNLLSNALKFGRGAPIEVEVTGDVERARLKVTDHGIGIAPENLVLIFDPFERAVSQRRYGGLGLGLYIVHTIVEALGGTVRVASDIGHGATFTVELPRRLT